MASAIITEATPTKNRRNLGWRRAANERGVLMAGALAHMLLGRADGPTRRPVLPHLRPYAGGRSARARAARRMPALRLDSERKPPRQPASDRRAGNRRVDPLYPGQHLSDSAHAFLWRLQRK